MKTTSLTTELNTTSHQERSYPQQISPAYFSWSFVSGSEDAKVQQSVENIWSQKSLSENWHFHYFFSFFSRFAYLSP